MDDKPTLPEIASLVDAAPHLAGIDLDEITRENVCANLATVLALAATLEDIGYEAAPVFRA